MNQIAISLIVSGVLLFISNTIYQRAKERGKDLDMIYLPLLIHSGVMIMASGNLWSIPLLANA